MFKNKGYRLLISDYEQSGKTRSKREYYLITCCYNVIHEMGHCLYQEYNTNTDNTKSKGIVRLEEELFCNDLAAAFWKTYGTDQYIAYVLKKTRARKAKLDQQLEFSCWDTSKNVLVKYSDIKAFYYRTAHINIDDGSLSFSHFKTDNQYYYDHFQEWSILEALQSKASLESVLNKITHNCRCEQITGDRLTYYPCINTPKKVIKDASSLFLAMGIAVPPIDYIIEPYEQANCLVYTKA